mmetsp:Transcript_8442/g.24193  ORF Transcript_8442/g.24193 Transcript_8442/m.24193 type:complete len:235 (+) Transcript_8442:3341-4045(+)
MGLVRQHCQRDVVTHAVRGLHSSSSHTLDHHLGIFLAKAVGRLELQGVSRAVDCLSWELRRLQLAQPGGGLEPLRVRGGVGNLSDDVIMLLEGARLEVSHNDLPGTQAALGNNIGGVVQDVIQHANLRRDVDHVIVGAPEAGRAQTIAIQVGADALAIAEHQQSRAVPSLLQTLPELVESLGFRVLGSQLWVVAVCLRHKSKKGLLGGLAGADHQLCQPIKVARVRDTCVNQRG